MVDVGEEGVQRPDALLEPGFEARPFLGRQDARHDVERDQPLGARVLAVDGERDADAVKQCVRLGALLREPLGGLLVAATRNTGGSAPAGCPSASSISS